MSLVTLKHGGHWEFLERIFKIKSPTFDRSTTKLIGMISDDIVQTFVYDIDANHIVGKLILPNKGFKQYTYARYSIDAFFSSRADHVETSKKEICIAVKSINCMDSRRKCRLCEMECLLD